MPSAESNVDEDNDRVRVTTWTFTEAGDATGEHYHAYDYVVVPLTGGTFDVANADGYRTTMVQVAGSPYFRVSGPTHDVISSTEGPAVFVEIELKG